MIATAALLAALGGGAYAAVSRIPDRSGVFHGCVNKSTGGLRVVKSASSCRPAKKRHGRTVFPGEFAIAWNEKGQQGDPGVSGPTGTPGQNGAAGATHVVVRTFMNTTNTNGTNAPCNAGEVATGGGGQVSGASLVASLPSPNTAGSTPTSWGIGASAVVGPGNLTAYVVCASP